jgi:hypothetical protein
MKTRLTDKNYISPDQWCDRLGRDSGMLVSGLYNWWFEINSAVKLISSFQVEIAPRHPNDSESEEDVDLYDILLNISIPLIAITEAGPNLFESLKESRETVSKKQPVGYDFVPTSKSDSYLSPQELESLERVVIDEVGYNRELFNSLVEIAGIARRYCIECEQLFHSERSAEEVIAMLKIRYVDEAKNCVSMKFLSHFP